MIEKAFEKGKGEKVNSQIFIFLNKNASIYRW